MNESDMARKVIQHLDFSLTLMEGEALSRLKVAREAALAAYHPEPGVVFDIALAGGVGAKANNHSGFGGFQPFHHAWVPLAALIFGLLLVSYWQNHHQISDLSEVDASLLAADLPVDAYLDNGFEAWLEDSALQ